VLFRTGFQLRDKMLICLHGMSGDFHFLIAQRFDVLGVRRYRRVALLLRLTGAQFHGTALRRKPRWAHPAIVFAYGVCL